MAANTEDTISRMMNETEIGINSEGMRVEFLGYELLLISFSIIDESYIPFEKIMIHGLWIASQTPYIIDQDYPSLRGNGL